MRHFLTLKDFSKAELYEIITLAFVHKHAKSHYRDFVPPHLHTASLRDKNVALIFEKRVYSHAREALKQGSIS